MASDKIKKQENQEIKRGRKTMNQKSKLTFEKIFEINCNFLYCDWFIYMKSIFLFPKKSDLTKIFG